MLKEYKKAFTEYLNTQNLEGTPYVITEDKLTGHVEFSYELNFKLRNSKMSFSILNSKKVWRLFKYQQTLFTPDFKEIKNNDWTNFDECLNAFQHWINSELKKYIAEKEKTDYLGLYLDDLAKELRSLRFSSNTQFNPLELAIIKDFVSSTLSFIQKDFEEQPTLESALNAINSLEVYSISQGRNDWHTIASATIIFVILTLNMHKEKGQYLLKNTIELILELQDI